MRLTKHTITAGNTCKKDADIEISRLGSQSPNVYVEN